MIAYNNLAINGEPVKMQDLADALSVQGKTVGEWIRKNTYGLADEFEKYQESEGSCMYVRTRAVGAV